jgi:ribonuclease VapC
VIIDSSALVAIVAWEPDGQAFAEAITSAESRTMSAATLVETYMVVDGRGDMAGSRRLDNLLSGMDIQVAPFTAEQARIAREAFRDFGRGSGHRARLNLGDCFSYALAKDTGEPLLYKGDDFGHTDVRRAR